MSSAARSAAIIMPTEVIEWNQQVSHINVISNELLTGRISCQRRHHTSINLYNVSYSSFSYFIRLYLQRIYYSFLLL